MRTRDLSGPWGEALAAEYLRKKHYRIEAMNYRTRLGDQDADRRYKALHGNYRCNLPCSSVSPEKEKDFIQESCKNEC